MSVMEVKRRCMSVGVPTTWLGPARSARIPDRASLRPPMSRTETIHDSFFVWSQEVTAAR